MPITLTDETKDTLVASIQAYFLDERGEEIGDLQSSLLLDFILEEIGPSIYNQAIKDAQAHLQRTVADLDVTLHELEFGWSGGRR